MHESGCQWGRRAQGDKIHLASTFVPILSLHTHPLTPTAPLLRFTHVLLVGAGYLHYVAESTEVHPSVASERSLPGRVCEFRATRLLADLPDSWESLWPITSLACLECPTWPS